MSEDRLARLEKMGYQLFELGRQLLAEVAHLSGKEVSFEGPPVPEPEAPEPETPLVGEERPFRPRIEGLQAVGRFGIINEVIAISRAQECTDLYGEFTRVQYAAKLGIAASATQPWLDLLKEKDILEFHAGKFACLVPPTMRDWTVRQEDPFTVEAAATATDMSVEDAEAELHKLVMRDILTWLEDGRLKYVPPEGGPTSRPRHTPPERERPSYELAMATGMPVRVRATAKATRRQRSVSGAGGIKGAKARDRRYDEMQAKKQERAEATKAKAQRQPGFKSRSGKRSRPAS